jgi:hypothetical protein
LSMPLIESQLLYIEKRLTFWVSLLVVTLSIYFSIGILMPCSLANWIASG